VGFRACRALRSVERVCVSIAVEAVAPFAWMGREVVVGDVLLVRPIEAASLTYRRKVRFAAAGRVVPSEVVPVVAPSTRRRYRRRDLTAEVAACDSSD